MILNVPVTATNMPEWVRLVANAVNQLVSRKLNAVSVDDDYTVVDGDDVVLGDATAAAFSVALPALATWTGKVVTVKKIDASANAVTIDAGSDTIDGSATVALSSQYDTRTLLAGPTEWNVISSV